MTIPSAQILRYQARDNLQSLPYLVDILSAGLGQGGLAAAAPPTTGMALFGKP